MYNMINKKQVKFYRVDNFKTNMPFLVPASFTLQQLIQKIKEQKIYSEFQVFLESQIIEAEALMFSLEKIASIRLSGKENAPTFYICQLHTESEEVGKEEQEYLEQIKQLMMLEEPTKSQWRGANGHVLFEGRNHSLIASCYKQCSRIHKSKSLYNLNMSEVLQDNQEESKKMSSQLKQVKELIATLKQKKSKEDLQSLKKSEVSKKYSNYDINFVTSLEKTYLTYMLKSGLKLTYVDYHEWNFGVIQRKLSKKDKIGIIGDYGTGLQDSYQLLQNMVIGQGVNVILHLGDVYYAGTPQEYQQNVASFIRKLRVKTKKEILFYSIPGNHDYYSWGMPFLCFIKEINSDDFTKQNASYFCLRSEDDKWQFLGADTAYHDSNPFDQINETNTGPRLRTRQLAWHKQKLQNFEGSTIFLSHHQLFSIHDRLCGSLSKYRHFSCINPILSKQLFEYMPYFSSWFWGHQHAFMLFRQHFWGVPRCRLLGNSSFHVIFDKEHPYSRKSEFPKIPFVVKDQQYMKNYLPVNRDSNEVYFNLCFGVIDLNNAEENLMIEYFCSPCYNSQTKKKTYFKYYKLYQEVIESRNTIKKRAKFVDLGEKYYLKNQIGLLLDCSEKTLWLSFKGKEIVIRPFDHKIESDHLLNHSPVYLTINSENSQDSFYYLTSCNQSVTFQKEPTAKSIWTISKKCVMGDSTQEITTINAFSIRNQHEKMFLSFHLQSGGPTVKLSNLETLWIFLQKDDMIPI